MNLVARQATTSDDVPAKVSSDTGALSPSLDDPASQDTPGASAADVGTTEASVLDTTNTAVSDPAITSVVSTTAAVSDPGSIALPSDPSTEQTFTSEANDASVAATSVVDSTQTIASDATTSLDPSQSVSDTESSLPSSVDSTVTSTASASVISETTSSLSTLSPSTSASTTLVPSSTSESSSSSSTRSTSDPPSSSSSSSSSTAAPSTSLTTSFAEIVSTINGQVTTIVTPVATLNADLSGSVTSSDRTAVIAGATAGGAALIILCLLAIFLYRRHQKRREALSHRYLPTPRSVMLAGEDDFDLAGPSQPRRGFSILGGSRKNRDTGGGGADDYRDLGSDSGRDVNSPVMRELPSEPPPRLLRPVASKTGSYFQEAVWPPPGEGSRLVDPLMAASSVDLHSIVDYVMGPQGGQTQSQNQNQNRRWSSEASSSTSSPPRPARLRGGAEDTSSSLYSESGTPTPTTGFGTRLPPFVPVRHGESPTMSSIDSAISISDSQHHQRDWSTDSATGLLAGMDRSARRSSGGSGRSWLPPGAAPPSAYSYTRATSPTLSSPLRIVSESPQHIRAASPSSRARGKANEAAQERGALLLVANPGSETEAQETASAGGIGGRSAPSSTTHSSLSLSISTSSTQRLRRAAEGPGTGSQTPYPDESPVDRRSIPPSLTHAWLLDIDEEEYHDDDMTPRPTEFPRPQREEIPSRYDMIRRDSEDAVSRTRTL